MRARGVTMCKGDSVKTNLKLRMSPVYTNANETF